MTRAELCGVVALDGPSGTGKSTVARRLATTLGAAYLDTGAMYRAVTLAVLRSGVDLSDSVEITSVARAATIVMGTDPVRPSVFLDGADVGTEIRGPEVTSAVSAVSAVPEVRAALLIEQRRLVRAAHDSSGGIVVEGRDIGTVVLPDAELKVYLTAEARARAQRRHGQDVAEGRLADDLKQVYADVRRRDTLDSRRTVAPLQAATDATELDTTELDVPEVLEQLTKLAESRGILVYPERTTR